MNVMGELASLLGLSALAGVIIGWCIRNFFGGSAKTKRQYAARDADEAVKDARHLRRVLNEKENELQDTKSTLQNLRRKDDSACLLYTSPSPRDATLSRMPSSA